MELKPPPLLRLPASQSGDPVRCGACHTPGAAKRHRTGCSVCHIPYRRGGTYLGKDPTIDKTLVGKLVVHTLQGTGSMRVVVPGASGQSWTGISLDNCFVCHFDVRQVEVSRTGPIHSHYSGTYGAKGGTLLCQDCHTTIEMHGDGNIPAGDSEQQEVRCEDCHGTSRRYPWELPLRFFDDEAGLPEFAVPRGLTTTPLAGALERYPPNDGYLLTSRGNPLGNVVKKDTRVWLYSATGQVHQVTLLKSAKLHNQWRSNLAKETHADTDGHTHMACTDCHTDWAPPCYGCHAHTKTTK